MYTHTDAHTHVLRLLFTFLCLSFEQRHTGNGRNKRARGSEDESLHRHRLQQRQQQYHTVCLGVSASVCERVCVCPGACVRCVSQDCQHISSQREPYRNRDICGVKGRQLAWPSLEKEEDGKRRGAGRGTGRRMEESRRELQTLPIIRGGVLSRLDGDENV